MRGVVMFRSAVLLGLESWFIHDQRALVNWSACDDDPNAPVMRSILEREGLSLEGKGPRQTDVARGDAKLVLYAPSDSIGGTHILYRNRKAPPAPWADAIAGSFLRGYLINNYVTWLGLVEFDRGRIDGLVADVRSGGLSLFDTLFAGILPTCIGEHVVLPYRAKRRAVCVLVLEPETPLPFGLEPRRSSELGTSVKPLRQLLGLKEIAAIAHARTDLLLMRGQDWGPPEIELAVTRFRPMPGARDETVIRLPATAVDLALALGQFPIYRHVGERLRIHPFLATRSDAYVRKISEHRRVYEAYATTFVRERTSASLLAMESEGCTEDLAERIAANRFFASTQGGASNGIEFDPDGQIFVKSHNNIIELLRRELATHKTAVTRMIRVLKDRERSYSEFFRDMAIAESTRENIKLQSVIRLLTIAAVVVALLALVIGLLTDETRSAMLEWLLSPFDGGRP
jgi:hypothetical protein